MLAPAFSITYRLILFTWKLHALTHGKFFEFGVTTDKSEKSHDQKHVFQSVVDVKCFCHYPG